MVLPRFREQNPLVMAIVGIVGTAALLAGTYSLTSLPLIVGPTYHAEFAESGGIEKGAPVWVAGVSVGKVTDVELTGNKVVVSFTAKGVRLGDQTTVAIKTGSLLGKLFLGVTPAGNGEMEGGATIPLARTSSPYNLSRSMEDTTQLLQDFDKPQLEAALNTFSETFQNTPQGFRDTFQNVRRLSETINSRDAALRELLQHANAVTGVLNDRTQQFRLLLLDGNNLLAELEKRRAELDSLFHNVTYVANQISGFVNENHEQFGPVLDRLNEVLEVLKRNNTNITVAVQRVSAFIGGLGEGVSNSTSFGATTTPSVGVVSMKDFLPQLAGAPLPQPAPVAPPGVAAPGAPALVAPPGVAAPGAPAPADGVPGLPAVPNVPLVGGN